MKRPSFLFLVLCGMITIAGLPADPPTRFLSKWDGKALRSFKGVETIDVTERLVQELNPSLSDKQKRVLADLQRQSPISLQKTRWLEQLGEW